VGELTRVSPFPTGNISYAQIAHNFVGLAIERHARLDSFPYLRLQFGTSPEVIGTLRLSKSDCDAVRFTHRILDALRGFPLGIALTSGRGLGREDQKGGKDAKGRMEKASAYQGSSKSLFMIYEVTRPGKLRSHIASWY